MLNGVKLFPSGLNWSYCWCDIWLHLTRTLSSPCTLHFLPFGIHSPFNAIVNYHKPGFKLQLLLFCILCKTQVYTINDESNYVLVQGVPALKLTKELLDLCSLYGAIQEYRLLEDFPEKEEFTQVYWIQYQQIQAARYGRDGVGVCRVWKQFHETVTS